MSGEKQTRPKSNLEHGRDIHRLLVSYAERFKAAADLVRHPLCADRDMTGVCGVCGEPLGGGPGGWFSLITALETCQAKNRGFHEPGP